MKPNTKILTEILDEYFTCGEGWDGNGKAAILQWVSETVVGSEARMGDDALAYDELVGVRKWQERQREILRKEGLKNE